LQGWHHGPRKPARYEQGMFTATILSWVLAAAPQPQQPTEFANALDHVEVVGASGEFVIWAFDANGYAVGAIAYWVAGNGIHIASDFADGYEEIVIVGERVEHDSTLAPGVAAARAQAMLDVLAPSDGPQESKIGCALSVAGAAIHCPGAVLLVPGLICLASIYDMACNCAEYVGPKPPEGWC
jgi:hypothetical protein